MERACELERRVARVQHEERGGDALRPVERHRVAQAESEGEGGAGRLRVGKAEDDAPKDTKRATRFGQLALRRPRSAPDRDRGCPELWPASVNQPLGRAAKPALFSDMATHGYGSLEVRTTFHSAELRHTPCLGPDPRPANCGQQIGTPPRIALPPPYSAVLETKSCSSPSLVCHEARCAP